MCSLDGIHTVQKLTICSTWHMDKSQTRAELQDPGRKGWVSCDSIYVSSNSRESKSVAFAPLALLKGFSFGDLWGCSKPSSHQTVSINYLKPKDLLPTVPTLLASELSWAAIHVACFSPVCIANPTRLQNLLFPSSFGFLWSRFDCRPQLSITPRTFLHHHVSQCVVMVCFQMHGF